jgi:hypothetical protein
MIKGLALHPQFNRAALLIDDLNGCHSIRIYDNDQTEFEPIARITFQYSVNQLAYIGNDTYVGLTCHYAGVLKHKGSEITSNSDLPRMTNFIRSIIKSDDVVWAIAVNPKFGMKIKDHETPEEKIHKSRLALVCKSKILFDKGYLAIYTRSHQYALNKETEETVLRVCDGLDVDLIEKVSYIDNTISLVYRNSEPKLTRIDTYKINFAHLFFNYIKNEYAPAYEKIERQRMRAEIASQDFSTIKATINNH